MAEFKNNEVKVDNQKIEMKEQAKSEKFVETTVAQTKENVNPKIENKSIESNQPKTIKRMGKLSAKIGRNVIIIGKDGKGISVPNNNYRNVKVGTMVEY